MASEIAVYKVRDWDRHFETSESRKRKSPLTWIGVPTKHDGRGFNRLKRHADWPAVYGAWVLIVAVAAKCPTRGTLADEDGPFTSLDISDKVGLPQELVQRCLDLLASQQDGIMWIEAVPADSGKSQQAPAESASAPADASRCQQTPAGHAGICCDSGKSQSYITGPDIHNTGAAPQQNNTNNQGARALPFPEADISRILNPKVSVITFPDGRRLDYDDDPLVWRAEFIRQWNELPKVTRHQGSALGNDNEKLLFRHLQDPAWDWQEAFKRFPVWRPHETQASMSWFLTEGIVTKILDGECSIRTQTKGGQHGKPRAGRQAQDNTGSLVNPASNNGANPLDW